MSMQTNWGYTLTDNDILPSMMDGFDYEAYSGRHDDVSRVEPEIAAASAAIRNFVGWHLFPSEACELSTIILDKRIILSGHDMIIQLPARYVTEATEVIIDGNVHEHYHIDTNGILRVFGVPFVARYASVIVRYVAGLPEEMMHPIRELIAHRVTHAMAVPAGITSEASGGISVTYNANWINNSRATALAGDNKELLIPYKVQGVF